MPASNQKDSAAASGVRRPLQRGAHVFIAIREAEQRWAECGVDPPIDPELLQGLRDLRDDLPSSRRASPSHTPPPVDTTPTRFIHFPRFSSSSPPSSPTPHTEIPKPHFTYPPTLSGPWLDTLLSSLHTGRVSLRTALSETQAELRVALESVNKARMEAQEEREEWDGFTSYLKETMGPFWVRSLRGLGGRGREDVQNTTNTSYETPPRMSRKRSSTADVEESLRASPSNEVQDTTSPRVPSKRPRSAEDDEDEDEQSRRKRARRDPDSDPEPGLTQSTRSRSPSNNPNPNPDDEDDDDFPFTAPPGITLFPSPPLNDDDDDYSYPNPPLFNPPSPSESNSESISNPLPPPFPPPTDINSQGQLSPPPRPLPKRPAPLKRTYQMLIISP